jgi:hypothetical protein
VEREDCGVWQPFNDRGALELAISYRTRTVGWLGGRVCGLRNSSPPFNVVLLNHIPSPCCLPIIAVLLLRVLQYEQSLCLLSQLRAEDPKE